MTALEEIKKAEHERIWLEPAGAPDRCWCQDNQWGDEGVEYVLASALERLQRENERLTGLVRDNGTPRFNAVCERAEIAEAEVKRLRALLEKIAPPEQSKSWLPISDWVECRTALASTGGEHNAE